MFCDTSKVTFARGLKTDTLSSRNIWVLSVKPTPVYNLAVLGNFKQHVMSYFSYLFSDVFLYPTQHIKFGWMYGELIRTCDKSTTYTDRFRMTF